MSLDAFGFELPVSRPRGPQRRSLSKVEVHRLKFDLFEILSEYGHGKHPTRRIVVEGANVRALWEAILHCEAALRQFPKVPDHPAIHAREVLSRLLEVSGPEGSYFRLISVDEAQAGINRAAFYFPRYFHPSQVLEIFYRAIERHGRKLRVSKEGDLESGEMT